jgi:hypothetical protein
MCSMSKRAIGHVVGDDVVPATEDVVGGDGEAERKDAGPLPSLEEKCFDFVSANFATFPKLVPLFQAIQRRFPNKKFPPADPRKEFQMLDILLDTIGGKAFGTPVLQAYLETPTRKDVSRYLNTCEDSVLENVREMLLDMHTRAYSSTDPVANTLRVNLVKIIQGLEGRGRDKLLSEGFLFSKHTWTKAIEHTRVERMNCYIQQDTGGRRSVSGDIRDAIRSHVMQPQYTKVLPDRHTGGESRAFSVDVRTVYEEFPLKHAITYAPFRVLVSGKKSSAVGADGDLPKIRKWIHETDHCQTCPQRQGSIAVVQRFVSQTMSAASDNQWIQDTFDRVVNASCQMDAQAGRAELAELEEWMTAVETATGITHPQLQKHMEFICDIGYHYYCKTEVRRVYKALTQNTLPADGSLGIMQFDWKANISKGRGGKEDSSVIHNTVPTAVFGFSFLYFNPKYQQNGRFFVALLTDVLDKTGEAAIVFIKAIMARLVTLDDFHTIWACIKKVTAFMDVGPHFKSQAFLSYLLIDFVKTYGKHTVGQFFPGGHGKTGPVDGVIFGQSGVGGAVKDLAKETRLRTTSQLVKYCVIRKEKHLALQDDKYRELHRWEHMHFKPPPFPHKCSYLEQLRIRPILCWESKKRGDGEVQANGSPVVYTGRIPVILRCHGAVYSSGGGVVMRQVYNPNEVGEYKISEHHPGWPGARREQWSLSEMDVRDAEPTNTQALGRERALNAAIRQQGSDHMQPAVNALTLPKTGGKRARPKEALEAEADCRIRQRWTRSDMNRDGLMQYSDIQEECKAHRISQTGTKKEMLTRLKSHYELHTRRTERAMGASLALMFKS